MGPAARAGRGSIREEPGGVAAPQVVCRQRRRPPPAAGVRHRITLALLFSLPPGSCLLLHRRCCAAFHTQVAASTIPLRRPPQLPQRGKAPPFSILLRGEVGPVRDRTAAEDQLGRAAPTSASGWRRRGSTTAASSWRPPLLLGALLSGGGAAAFSLPLVPALPAPAASSPGAPGLAFLAAAPLPLLLPPAGFSSATPAPAAPPAAAAGRPPPARQAESLRVLLVLQGELASRQRSAPGREVLAAGEPTASESKQHAAARGRQAAEAEGFRAERGRREAARLHQRPASSPLVQRRGGAGTPARAPSAFCAASSSYCSTPLGN